MIKGIFFDVGGTLYSYRNLQPAMMVLMETLAARLELDIAEATRHYQLANKEVDRLMADKPFYLFRDYFEAIFTNFLNRVDKQHLQSHFGWFEEFKRETLLGSLEIRADCHETLARLKDMGLYLSAVSNADENQLEPLIKRAQLHRWLTHWTSSEAAQSCKPDRRFFEIALKKSGLSPDQVLFVGDSLEQDIQGAHAVGMTTVLISEIDQPAPMHIGRETPEPDFSITRLSELPAIIERFGGHIANF
ncbi:MAG: HAD family hydrolase [Sterolibacterium sp.]|nr:HAD family hydrolase [Sterolibacterium sp.]